MAREKMTAEKVRQIRESLGWSQAELAENLGVNQSTVSHWETGFRSPTGPTERLLKQFMENNSKKPARRVLQGR